MSSQSSRLPRAVALGASCAAVAIGAVAATGCGGDDENNVNDALQSVTEALSTVQEQAESVRSEADEQAESVRSEAEEQVKSVQEQAQSVQSEAESELEQQRQNDDLRGGGY